MSSAIEYMLEGDWLKFLTEPALTQTSEGAMALFLVGIVLIPTWLRGGDVTIPAVVLVLFSGLLIPMMPGSLIGVMWGIVWIAGTVAIYKILDTFR